MLLRYLLLLVNLSVQYGVTDALLVQPQSNLRPSLDTVTPQSNNNLRKWKQRFLSASRFFGIGNSRNTSPVRHKKQIAAKNLAPYVNDVVLRFNISGHHDSEIRALSDATDRLYLDVWSYTNDHMDIRLTRGTIPLLLDLLPKSLQDSHTPLMHSLIEQALDTYPNSPESTLPHVPEPASQPKADILFFQDYQPLSVITPWMKLLQSMFPSFVEVVTIGKSYEGRDIHGLKVGMKTDPDVNKKTIIMTGAAHAREWISVSTISYLAYSMVTRYKKEDRGIDNMVDKFDWIFIPTLNVDGYVYTWKEDRLWRKNRQPTKLAFCKGIDLDRAYDFHFDNTPESSSNPCSDMFPGGYPFQAQEARVFAEWVSNYTADGNQILGLIDFHSYSQQILYPFSYSCRDAPPDLENLEELGMGMAKAIRLQSGEHYDVTSACEGTGFSKFPGTTGNGSMLDYVYGVLRVPYSFQIKLRDLGSYGFLLPKESIIPAGEEMFSLLRYFSQWLLDDGGPTIKDGPGEL